MIYYLITFITSFSTMAYAMIISSLVSDFTGEEIFSQCFTMGPYLLGLGVGSYLGDKTNKDHLVKNLWNFEWISFLILPLIPFLFIIFIFLYLHLSPMGTSLESKQSLKLILFISSLISFISGLLGGAQLPLCIKLTEQKIKTEIILAFNYLGPLLAAPFIIFTNFKNINNSQQAGIIAIIQFLGLFLLSYKLNSETKKRLSLIGIPIIFIILINDYYKRIEYLTIKASYIETKIEFKNILEFSKTLDFLSVYGNLERVKTPYQVIDFFSTHIHPEISNESTSTLYLNRKTQFNNLTSDVYHQTMIHAGINLSFFSPKNILLLGGGDGVLLSEIQKNINFTKIKMVELDERMVDWAKENKLTSSLNHNIFSQNIKGIEIIFEDAITYLRKNKGQEKFDLIFIDFPFPNGHELTKLYSVEFYKMVVSTLSENGVVVIDMPLNNDKSGKLAKESRTILATLKTSGFKKMIGFGPHSTFVAASTSRELKFNFETLPNDISLSAKINFATILDNESIDKEIIGASINSMFWPRGL